jgi:hypothetical protein
MSKTDKQIDGSSDTEIEAPPLPRADVEYTEPGFAVLSTPNGHVVLSANDLSAIGSGMFHLSQRYRKRNLNHLKMQARNIRIEINKLHDE